MVLSSPTLSTNGLRSEAVDNLVVQAEAAPPLDEPKLTLELIKEYLAKGRVKFRGFYQFAKTADEFFLGEFNFSVPDNGTMIRLGTAQSVINTLVAHVTPQFTDVTVPPPGPRGQPRAELIEKFLRGANHMIEQETPVEAVTAMHMGLYGVGWEKIEFVAQKWADFPVPPDSDGDSTAEYREQLENALERRHIDWPIEAEAVNPQSMVWDTNNGMHPRWVVYFKQVESAWVKAHFPEWNGPDRGMVDWVETWTQSQVAFVADHRWAIQPRKHGYGILPWTMYWPQAGLVTLGNKPEHLYRGILHGNFEMLRGQSRLASHYLDIVGNSAWRTKDFKGPQGITEQVMEQYEESPGSKNYVPQNVEITVSETAEPPQSVIIAREMLSSAISENTAPGVTRGERPRGAASGFETAVLSGIAALVNFGPYVKARQHGLQQRNGIVLRIVENVIRDRVTVWGRTEAGPLDAAIRPKDIRGHYANIVALSPTSPEEQERRVNMWSSKWREGYVDHQTALRKGGVSNALEVLSRLQVEKLVEGELVQSALQQAAAARIPLLQNIIEAAQGGVGSSADADEIAQNILNTQGQAQLPNAGNFAAGNQPDRGLASESARVATNTRPVMPGSLREADLVAREVTLPRTGNRRVPTSDLPPGLLK